MSLFSDRLRMAFNECVKVRHQNIMPIILSIHSLLTRPSSCPPSQNDGYERAREQLANRLQLHIDNKALTPQAAQNFFAAIIRVYLEEHGTAIATSSSSINAGQGSVGSVSSPYKKSSEGLLMHTLYLQVLHCHRLMPPLPLRPQHLPLNNHPGHHPIHNLDQQAHPLLNLQADFKTCSPRHRPHTQRPKTLRTHKLHQVAFGSRILLKWLRQRRQIRLVHNQAPTIESHPQRLRLPSNPRALSLVMPILRLGLQRIRQINRQDPRRTCRPLL